jgi:hypothetical protein
MSKKKEQTLSTLRNVNVEKLTPRQLLTVDLSPEEQAEYRLTPKALNSLQQVLAAAQKAYLKTEEAQRLARIMLDEAVLTLQRALGHTSICDSDLCPACGVRSASSAPERVSSRAEASIAS